MPPFDKILEICMILSTAGNVRDHSIGHDGPSRDSCGLHLLCRVQKGGCSLPYELLPLVTMSSSAIRSELHKISESTSF